MQFDVTCIFAASESKAEMCAAVWRLPTDFDDVPSSEDQSSHRCMELVCRLEPGDSGDMKRSGNIFCRSQNSQFC